MQNILFTHIKQLAGILSKDVVALRGSDLNILNSIDNAWLRIENGRIHSFGRMADVPTELPTKTQYVDCTERLVLPAFVDSHTHLVFAGTREDEFAMRLAGMSYEEIALRGGGILNSAKKLANASHDELLAQALPRLNDVIAMGTGAIEIKSGYGLDVANELKMLRVIKTLATHTKATIKATFLGLHAIPAAYKNNVDGFVDVMINEALPAIAEENLADYVDVFCEKGYFNLTQTERFLEAAMRVGLAPKVHVNQFNALGAIPLCTRLGAVSVDHLEVMEPADFEALSGSKTVATLLPICSLMINIPYAPARDLIAHNAIIALATDFNPGSAPGGNMQLAQSLACVNMKLTPTEAFHAATINGAAALQLSSELGSITEGKKANLIVTKPIPSVGFIAYNVGHNHVEKVFLEGEFVR